ncbi:uncharacterized protein J8A68_004040 [[Candida] subhashii]|uniref:NADH:ubiquinone oxidoreductase intermediate-associated protein 30 domain-containing protein n=1 Tax=[Candida] subhashii TaxID=561895 RepID=A0A8J5QKU2_9ASCO|nr:uncharacterized protein J8A68_004040 [[Candida] subhashii]KAG7662392.1 hypothetical protein J8A68_004040 [[Candida] subhashii]
MSAALKTLGRSAPLLRNLFPKTGELYKPVRTVLDFKNKPEECLSNILTRSDKDMGGYSTVNFDIDPQENVGHFHGYLSLDLPKNKPEVTRSGYAMFRTRDLPESWFNGQQYWDWGYYTALALRVKGDRRKYLVNIQTNTPLVTDLFQHRLFLNTPGQWETVVIPLQDFVMTNYGTIQDGSEINKDEVKTVGIGLLDKQYGPYSLKIDWIKVMTDVEAAKVTKQARTESLSTRSKFDEEQECYQLQDESENATPADRTGAAISVRPKYMKL